MLHATLISSLIDGHSTSHAPSMIAVDTDDNGTIRLMYSEIGAFGENTLSIPTERKVAATADMLRQRWYLHVSMPSGRVDITVASQKQQSGWLAGCPTTDCQ